MSQFSVAKLDQYRKEIANYQREITILNRKLLAAPAKYGFDSMGAFISALRLAGKGASVSGASSGSMRKKRVEITPEMRLKIKALVEAGKTGSEIAEKLGISLPSVQNAKKKLGLVKARK